MTLRHVLVLVAAAPLLAQESLTVAGKLHGMLDAYLTGIAEHHLQTRAAKVRAMRAAGDVERRQRYIRETILKSLGGFPEKTPLNTQITGAFERDGYRVEKLIYESLPGFRVTANVYVPTRAKPPFAAVLGTAGHSDTGKAAAFYQSAWISMARRGWLVLAYDPPGQGERSEYWDEQDGHSRVGIGTREHTMAGIQCLLTGTNIARYEIWDGIRAVDYLLTRSDVDPKRIAVAGNSGGGTQAAYLAVLEPRLAAAAPSCYITSWEKLWAGPGPQDTEQNFFGFISRELDFPDFLIAFSPKPIKMMTAIRDFFPIDGARATFAEAAAVFELAGARDKVDFFEFDDGHGWSKPRREATYRFFEKWLNGRDDEGVEGEVQVEPAPALNATVTGQLATSGGSETVASLNAKLAESMHASRAATKSGDLAGLVSERLGVSKRRPPGIRKMGEVGRDGYRIEKVALDTEPGITVPALVFVPATGRRPRPAVIHVNSAGKSADASPGGDIEALVRTGHIVLALDPRGWGESSAPPSRSSYSPSYQTFMRAYLLGRSVAGMQAGDVLSAFDYLRSRPDIDSSKIAAFGKGNGGVLALFAAILEPGIAKVAVERMVSSYLAIARASRHDGVLDIIVPGILNDFDLPDLIQGLAPRPVWIVDPRTPVGAASKANEYHTRDGLRITTRPEGWSFEKVYADWLAL